MLPVLLSFIEIKFLDILDILLVALLLYELYNLLKGTVAINIFFGIVAFYLLWKLVTALDMEMLSEIFGAFISVGFIALIVVFQPEIRKFLLMLGTPGFIKKKRHRLLFWKFEVGGTVQLDIDEIIDACRHMSETKTGALIIIANKSGLEQFVETGERLDARISSSLLENIFFKNSPLHDGAVIIRNNKIVAARCILPVSSSPGIPSHFGLRHRSAIGLTEQSDAIAIIVSEETGNISFSAGGDIKEKISSISLKSMILEELS
jgi:uncharacterized protein (TIGR00159 family)